MKIKQLLYECLHHPFPRTLLLIALILGVFILLTTLAERLSLIG